MSTTINQKSTKRLVGKMALLLLTVTLALPVMAQGERTISGVVRDVSENPLAGVTVLVPGTTHGTSTDEQGSYIISVGDAEYLEYTCLGYKNQRIKLGTRAFVDVVLEEDKTSLDEIVVVGYGVQKRRDIVGAIETLNTEEIQERTGANMGISRTLQGAIPGLTLTFDDGKPNRDANIRIRGVQNSIGSGGSALVLLDGVEVSMSSVNPNDIESVTVLKDASSTAVYGARGTFGVILLTSKTPQKGAAKITYDGALNIYQRTVTPDMITNGYEYATNFLESYNNGMGSDPTGINNLFPFSRDWYEELGRRDGDPTADYWRINSSGAYEYFGNTDWWDLFYKKCFVGHQHNLTVSGGSDIASYYVSGRVFSQGSQYKVGNECWYQYNIMAKGTVHIKPWLHFTETVDYSYNKSIEPGQFSSGESPHQCIGEMFGEELFPVAVPYNPDGTWTANAAKGYAEYVDGDEWRMDLTGKFGSKTVLELDMIKDVLWATADFGYRTENHEQSFKRDCTVYYNAPDNPADEPVTSSYLERIYSSQRIMGDVTLNYVPRIGENHYLAFMVGWNLEYYKYKATHMYRTGMLTGQPNWNLLEGDTVTISDKGSYEWETIGAFFRVNYNFKSRYLFEASGRYDGSSKFPSNSRWGFFPSGSVGWRISEEPFMKGADWLDNLKIRFSVGSAGNGLISDAYAYISTMSLSQSSMLDNGATFKYTSAPTPVPEELTWEAALTYDLGLDFEALDGRLNFVGDIYRKKTNNMYVVGEELPAVFGNSAPKGNYADMKTDGWEVSAGWRDSYNVGGKMLSYNIKGAVWDSKSIITRYTSKTGSFPTIYSTKYYEGMVLGEFWGYVCNGLFESNEEVAGYANTSKFTQNKQVISAGDPKFEDLNGDGVIDNGNGTIYDPGDMVVVGNTSPRYCYSFSGGISWNGISLNFMFQGVGKRDWYPAGESYLFWGQYNRPYSQFFPWYRDRWTEDNPDPNAYWPRLVAYESQNGSGLLRAANTRWIQNASYLRLKNLSIDYSFPRKITSKMKLEGLKIYVNFENLLTFTPLKKHASNYDPEGLYPGDSDYGTNNEGAQGYGDGDNYPFLKSYTIGLSITL